MRHLFRVGEAAAALALLWACVAGCAAVRSSPAAPRAEACAGVEPVDVIHHAIELSVHLQPPSLSGSGRLDVKVRQATAALAIDAHGLRISEVSTSAGAVSWAQSADRLCITLPKPLIQGTALSVSLKWEVSSARNTPTFLSDEVWAGYDTAAWMPTVMDSAQRATLSLAITADEALEVAASGHFTGRAARGKGLTAHTFTLETPTPPFLYAFAVGRFEEATLISDGVRFRALGPPGADLLGALTLTAEMARFLAERTATPLPTGEYLQVFVHGQAAQEAAGMAILSASALDDVRVDPTDDWIFAHELAHQWFAWLVPCADFSDFWLNEGLATFLVGVVKEHRWGRPAYEKELDVWRQRSAKVHAEGRDAPVSLFAVAQRPPRDNELRARGVTYFRGALVLHRLRLELGEDAFWDGIRRYVKARPPAGARSEDLRAALEAASGRELRAFFARWVYSPAADL
jgi:aminopeptidase N